MSRPMQFSEDKIAEAALALVREEGWEALTARGVAKRLRCSVAPVYSAFGSMEGLIDRALSDGAELLRRSGERAYGDDVFLNRGVGLVVFARDEPRLFLALYRLGRGGVFDRYRAGVRAGMRQDLQFARVDEAELDRIFERLWTYAMGMALAMLFDYVEDTSDEAVLRSLRDAGAALMYGVLSGLDDHGSRASKDHWHALSLARAWEEPDREGEAPA